MKAEINYKGWIIKENEYNYENNPYLNYEYYNSNDSDCNILGFFTNKLKTKMKKLLLLIPFAILSCNNGLDQEALDKYKGGIIYEKVDIPRHLIYSIKINNEIKTVRCYEAEFKYNVGDTIK